MGNRWLLPASIIALVVFIALPYSAFAQTSTLIVAGKSLGDLTVDMPLSVIRERLGAGECRTIQDRPEVGVCEWRSAGIWVSYNTQDESTRVLTKALLGSTVWKTDKGLGSLSTEAEVIRAYGSPEQVGPSTIIYRRDADVQEVRTKVLLYISQGIRFALFDDPRTGPVNGRVFEIGVFKPNAKL